MPSHLVRLVYLCFGMTMLLSSCGFREGPPRLEPVEFGGIGNNIDLGTKVIASTNCAQIGEWVTFEVVLHNGVDFPIELTDSPPFDLILKPAQWNLSDPQPIERWSDSYQYPQEIDRVLEPGERQSYTWKWQANTQFTQQDPHENMIRMTFWRGHISRDGRSPSSAGSLESFMGVEWYSGDIGTWACTDMPR